MNRIFAAAGLALLAVAVMAGCKKKDDTSPVPTASTPPPVVTPAPAPAPARTVTVTSVDLGSAVGPDFKVTTPTTVFKSTDTIYASVSTMASDATMPISGRLTAKWTFGDGQAVNEETREFNFMGPGTTEFHISKPDGWPVGKYRVEVSLDGKLAATKDFEVQGRQGAGRIAAFRRDDRCLQS